MKRLAIVLYNLGGPDRLEAVEPFLFNLFMDPAIITVPQPFRWMLAKLISKRRAPLAQDIYKHIGGKSPLLDLTNEQARALETALRRDFSDVDVQAFVCMRYWHPMSDAVAQEVKAFNPDHIVMLPLYPQYSTTTSESSFLDWDRAASAVGLRVPNQRICCYPTEPGLVAAQTELLKVALDKARALAGQGPVRILFSAHGLPKKIVDRKGDPYPQHVQQGAEAIVAELQTQGVELDEWLVSYQSRVGPLEWIGPSTDDEIRRAGRDGVALVVLPIAFVSEHSETLVELDIEYKHLADEVGVKTYVRVPAVATHEAFIKGLSNLVQSTLDQQLSLCPGGSTARICAKDAKACPMGLL
ncbi:ferrochelatase [Magnetovibrio sp.]|uniref:ferrochelatase n=1 Tax=Magnetovibrio sp. TaxID=2024836 RepID=UPI002F91FCFA